MPTLRSELLIIIVYYLTIISATNRDFWITNEFTICYMSDEGFASWHLYIYKTLDQPGNHTYRFTKGTCSDEKNGCFLQAGNTLCWSEGIPCDVSISDRLILRMYESGYPHEEIELTQVNNTTYFMYNWCQDSFYPYNFNCLTGNSTSVYHEVNFCQVVYPNLSIDYCNEGYSFKTCSTTHSPAPNTTMFQTTKEMSTTYTTPELTISTTTEPIHSTSPDPTSTTLTSTMNTSVATTFTSTMRPTTTVPTTVTSTMRPNTTLTVATSTTTATTLTSTVTTPTTGTPTTKRRTTPTVTMPTPMSLQNLSDAGVGLENVTEVLDLTLTFSEEGPALDATDLTNIATILSNSANLNGINGTDAESILLNMDYMLNANESQIQDSGCQITLLNMLPTMVINTQSNVIQYTDGANFGFLSNNFASQTSSVNGLKDDGVDYSPIDSNNFPASKQNEIFVPSTDFTGAGCTDCGSHVLFSIYRNKKLFVGTKKYRPYGAAAVLPQNSEQDDTEQAPPPPCQQQVQPSEKSPVMSASVITPSGVRISRLDQVAVMAKLKFNVTTILRPLHGGYQVTWWDDINQIWSTEELCTSQLNNGVVEANCPHLTDFTLIIDAMVNDPCVCDKALENVGIVMNSISIAALFLLLVIQLTAYVPYFAMTKFLRTLRGDAMTSSRDVVQIIYNTVLFLFYLVFSIFSNQSISGSACELIAAFSYSLLLCSLLLTIFQSQRTVMIFFPVLLQKIIKLVLQPLTAFTVCFLIPFTLSLMLRFFTPFFDRQDAFCWVRPDYVVYATIIPVSILILNAIICTILVCWRLFFSKRKFSKAGRQYDSQLYQKIGAVLIMQITMGMPWILQYFTLYQPKATAWHYVFTIVMGSQGLIIAILYFYRSNRLRLSAKSKKKNGFNSSSAAYVNSATDPERTRITSLD